MCSDKNNKSGAIVSFDALWSDSPAITVVFAIEFVSFALEFVALEIEFDALVVELGAIALELVMFAGNFITTNQ